MPTEVLTAKAPMSQLQWDALIAARCGELAPGLSVGEALLRFWDDPTLQALYQRYLTAHPEQPGPVKKSLPGDGLWSKVERLALRERRADETREAAIARVFAEVPDAYDAYMAEREAG